MSGVGKTVAVGILTIRLSVQLFSSGSLGSGHDIIGDVLTGVRRQCGIDVTRMSTRSVLGRTIVKLTIIGDSQILYRGVISGVVRRVRSGCPIRVCRVGRVR